jgi:hypothetical protein
VEREAVIDVTFQALTSDLEYGTLALFIIGQFGLTTAELASLARISEREVTAALEFGPEPSSSDERVLLIGAICAHAGDYSEHRSRKAALAWLHSAPPGETRTRSAVLKSADRLAFAWGANPHRSEEVQDIKPLLFPGEASLGVGRTMSEVEPPPLHSAPRMSATSQLR